jgi:ATP-dependent RNA helicase DeaD
MSTLDDFPALLPALRHALEQRGFTDLTPVQAAVLAPELRGRDLRVSSRTGSGKTVALGLVAADVVVERVARGVPHAPPTVLVITPTRELAAQVGEELGWLYADLGVGLCVVTGGTSTSQERRNLRSAPGVVVGTPGRLCDHLGRGALDLSAVEVIVLDEADQMLDLGFREALEMLLGAVPAECARHLVSATFLPSVRTLADRFQRDPAMVQATKAAEAHADIEHIGYLVHPRERYEALVNLLLMQPGERALLFVRTRIDAAELSQRLVNDGFRAAALSGELAQAERTRTLDAFKRGTVEVLVCTDVAARGIDVPELSRVVHADVPDSPEQLIHRSGRTGRAGKKGTSAVLVTPDSFSFAERLFERARIHATLRSAPEAALVAKAQQKALMGRIRERAEALAAQEGEVEPLVEKLITELGAEPAVRALLSLCDLRGAREPAELTKVEPRAPRPPKDRVRTPRAMPPAARPQRGVIPMRDNPRRAGGALPVRRRP